MKKIIKKQTMKNPLGQALDSIPNKALVPINPQP